MPKSTRLSSRQKYINRNNKPTEKRLALRYAMIKAHAAERDITFTLTLDEFIKMWSDQKGICGYTGRRMLLAVDRGYKYRDCSVSIDRLDPAGAYTEDNVVLCRYDANRRKSRRSVYSVAFLELCPDYVAIS